MGPGVGQYEHRVTIGKEAQSRSIGEKREPKGLQGELGPGPAGYFFEKPRKHNISYSMAEKLEDLDQKARNFQPGPGRYESHMSKTGPSAKIGTGNRSQLDGGKETRLRPGPGNYMTDESPIKYSAPKFAFGKANRIPDMRSSAPGPG